MKKGMLNKIARGEKGQALLIVLIMMLFGSLIIPPVLSHISTGLWTGQVVYEEEMKLLYAADAGVEDALWQIKNGRLPTLLSDYDPYNYDDSYPYPNYPDSLVVNGRDVGITIGNVWIPKEIDPPSPNEAINIIKHGKLLISGGISQVSATWYQIGIIYYYGSEGTDALRVKEIGIWLPPGFDYAGDCNLANDPDTQSWATPDVSNYNSGKAVVWTFGGSPMFKVFPGIPTTPPTPNPMISTITFAFTGPAGQSPQAAISWIDTSGVNNLVPGFSGITYTWDADKKVYEINSTAIYADKQTEVDAYAAKIEPRQMGSAVSGDYVAIGNTLMTPIASSSCRERLYMESSAEITTASGYGYIPVGVTVEAVYLYWSGWIDHFYWYYQTTTPTGWNFGELGELNRLNYETDLTTLVETNAKVNTVNFNGTDITTHIWQVCPKDNDTPGTWYYTCFYDVTDMVKTPIEDAIKPGGSGTYNFTLGHASTVINQLRPSCPGQQGDASGVHIYNFSLYNTTDYTGYPLATPAHTASGGTGSSYLARYNAAYAGWSLVIIYSSPDTEGHQLYLYDIKNPNFRFTEGFGDHTDPDFDGDGNPGGRISGFLVPAQIAGEINAAKLTCFVGEGDAQNTGDYIKITGQSGTSRKLWDGITISGSNTKSSPNNIWNSRSLVLGTVSGVDIDTPGVDPQANPPQYITWSSNVLRQGDTYATINLPSPGDGFTLIYIILSFRSEITTGGTMSYLVR